MVGLSPESGAKPVLVTERLRLEPLTAERHTEDLVDLDSDPAVLRFIFGRALGRDEVVGTWMAKRTSAEADARGLGYWAGYAGPGRDRFVGWWCLGYDGDHPGEAELGYRLRRDAWSRGYATEGARALVAHGFETVGLKRIWAETMAVNSGSRGVMTKLGMRHVSTEVREWDDPLPGWEQGEVVYELTCEEWTSPQSTLPKQRDNGESL